MKTIYLDNNATTKIAPEVLDEMKPYLTEYYGNPSSMHTFGGKLYAKIEESRAKVAGLIGAEPEEIIFMSCGTESDNTALMSAAESFPQKRHIVTTRVEHPAVFNFVKHLVRKGYRVTFIPVDNKGKLDMDAFSDAIDDDTYRCFNYVCKQRNRRNIPCSSKLSNLFKVAKWMHTIEPILSYRYNPRVNQTRLPTFDEVDRVPYANEITYGATQRLIGRPAKDTTTSRPFEYAKLMIFQSYSLVDPSWFTSKFIDEKGNKRSFSNIGAELWLNFNPNLSARWSTEFNPYRGNFDVMDFLISMKDRRNDANSIPISIHQGPSESDQSRCPGEDDRSLIHLWGYSL